MPPTPGGGVDGSPPPTELGGVAGVVGATAPPSPTVSVSRPGSSGAFCGADAGAPPSAAFAGASAAAMLYEPCLCEYTHVIPVCAALCGMEESASTAVSNLSSARARFRDARARAAAARGALGNFLHAHYGKMLRGAWYLLLLAVIVGCYRRFTTADPDPCLSSPTPAPLWAEDGTPCIPVTGLMQSIGFIGACNLTRVVHDLFALLAARPDYAAIPARAVGVPLCAIALRVDAFGLPGANTTGPNGTGIVLLMNPNATQIGPLQRQVDYTLPCPAGAIAQRPANMTLEWVPWPETMPETFPRRARFEKGRAHALHACLEQMEGRYGEHARECRTNSL